MISYRRYEEHLLGRSKSFLDKLIRMVSRSFAASSFAGFWRVWNPLFSYYLLKLIYRPVIRVLPRPVAVMTTFTTSGFIHDVFASCASFEPFVLFTPFFLCFGVIVVTEEHLGLHRHTKSAVYRVLANSILLLSVGAIFIPLGNLIDC